MGRTEDGEAGLWFLGARAAATTKISLREFEQFSSPKGGFFSATLANADVFDGLSPFPIYLTHPAGRFPQASMQIKGLRTYPDYHLTMMMDKYGSGPLHKRSDWLPEPLFQTSASRPSPN